MTSDWRLSKPVRDYIGVYLGVAVFSNVVPGPWQTWDKGTIFDNYSWAHLGMGAVGGAMGLTFNEMLILGALNEGIEAVIRRKLPGLSWGSPEIWENIISDLVANQLGWALGAAVRRL